MSHKATFEKINLVPPTTPCPVCGKSFQVSIDNKTADITTECATLIRLATSNTEGLNLGKQDKRELKEFTDGTLVKKTIIRCERNHKYHVLLNPSTKEFSFDDATSLIITEEGQESEIITAPRPVITSTVVESNTIETTPLAMTSSTKTPVAQSEDDWLFERRYPFNCSNTNKCYLHFNESVENNGLPPG